MQCLLGFKKFLRKQNKKFKNSVETNYDLTGIGFNIIVLKQIEALYFVVL